MNLLIFDVDGTLTHTTGVDDEAFVAAVREVMGFTIADTDWANYRHSTDQGLVQETTERHLGRTPLAEEVQAVKRVFVGLLRERIGREPDRCRPVRGVVQMLERVTAGGEWACGIASGAWPESAAIKLELAGVRVAGLPATYSHADTRGNPLLREEIVGATMARLANGSTARRVVYVGDGVWDARAARRLGIGFVGVRADGQEERMRAEGVERIIHDYRDVDRFLTQAAGACERMATPT